MTNKRFIVTNHEYFNTGGSIMVSIFAVYDTTDNATRWVIANDEGFNWQTADTVSNSDFTLDCDELIDKVVLGSWSWEALTSEPAPLDHQFTEDEFELFKYCEYEFYKKDCKYFGRRVRVSADRLPNNLYVQLTSGCVDWHNDHGEDFLTDGENVYVSQAYLEYRQAKNDMELQLVDDFKKWLDIASYEPESLGEYITVAVAGNSVKIPMHADTYDKLDTFLKNVIEEW